MDTNKGDLQTEYRDSAPRSNDSVTGILLTPVIVTILISEIVADIWQRFHTK